MPKTHYQTSGKINRNPLLIAAVIAFSACIWVSKIYGSKTEFYDTLADQLLPMILWTLALTLIFVLFRHFNQSRSPKVNVYFGIVFSLASWLTNWVLYRDMEMKGIHFVELILVSLPICIMPVMRYYCENCKEYYTQKTAFILEASKYYKRAKQTADYRFLTDLTLDMYQLPEKGPKEPKEIIKIDFHCCESCGCNAIVDIDAYTWGSNPEHNYWLRENPLRHFSGDSIRMGESIHTHRSHKKSTLSREKEIARGVYLDAETGSKLQKYLVG